MQYKFVQFVPIFAKHAAQNVVSTATNIARNVLKAVKNAQRHAENYSYPDGPTYPDQRLRRKGTW
jgi:hypothetical protein